MEFMELTFRDWTEDYQYENGNYECLCLTCHQRFYGYKGRYICKVCHPNAPPKIKLPMQMLLSAVEECADIVPVGRPIELIKIAARYGYEVSDANT